MGVSLKGPGTKRSLRSSGVSRNHFPSCSQEQAPSRLLSGSCLCLGFLLQTQVPGCQTSLPRVDQAHLSPCHSWWLQHRMARLCRCRRSHGSFACRAKCLPCGLGDCLLHPSTCIFFGWFLQLAEIVLNSKILPSPVPETPHSLLIPVDGRCTLCFSSPEPSPTASADMGQPMPTPFTRLSRSLMEKITGCSC